MAAFVDWGNFHPYPGGNAFNQPVAYDTIAKYYWDSTFPSLPLVGFGTSVKPWFPYYDGPYMPKPMGATETGYSTNTDGENETVVGKYLPRLYLEFFRFGIKRTFAYEFVDERVNPGDRESNFGMLHNDLSPKPSYTAVKSLIHLVDADSSTFSPEMLDIDIVVSPVTVAASTVRPGGGSDMVTFDRVEYVRHVLLGTKDGRRFVVLWHDISDADHSVTPAIVLTPPPMPTKLTVNAKFDHALLHSFDDKGVVTSKQISAAGAIALDVPDRPLVVELVPRMLEGTGGGGNASGGGAGASGPGTTSGANGGGGSGTGGDADSRSKGGCSCELVGRDREQRGFEIALISGLIAMIARRRRRSQRG
jgi:uncharacterized membrane protein YgcG